MSLRMSAIIFCVFWTAAMLWCSDPLDLPKIAGVLSALAWLWFMGLVAELRPREQRKTCRSRPGIQPPIASGSRTYSEPRAGKAGDHAGSRRAGPLPSLAQYAASGSLNGAVVDLGCGVQPVQFCILADGVRAPKSAMRRKSRRVKPAASKAAS